MYILNLNKVFIYKYFCHSDVYEQSDIATTLSVLLGLPIPASSIGSVIPELIQNLTNIDQLSLLHYSSKRLLQKITDMFDEDFVKNKGLFCTTFNLLSVN